ncbi:hypothetical protein LOC67_12175 [Stieleria sp. JC731]|uniref:Kelch repeat-containing protein n=1 Tax=Pirellulaceae TaxID=2691357 RepID=UPI001E525D98|nr:kelch repeat-containing protein [Stieleria sp. JC731]MCC9601304.1 hypothetical protein [Stieleria sp. JC731]
MSLSTDQANVQYQGGVAGAVVDDTFYVVGGMLNPFDHLDSAYGIPTNGDRSPRSLAPLPTPRANVVAVASEGKLFTVAGGISDKSNSGRPEGPSTVVEAFDVATGAWKSCQDLPARRVKPGVAIVGQTLYVLGGREDKVDANTIFAYDIASDEWALVGTLPYAARHGAACSFDGLIYYSGGWSAGPDGGTFQNALIEFDPQSNRCRDLSPMPEPRTAHAIVAHAGSLYVLGGIDTKKTPTSTVFRYHIAEDRWSACDSLQSNRAVFACGVRQSAHAPAVLLAGGWQKMHRQANDTLETYLLPIDG